MNFDGVMKITIPEGLVKKIECAGKVLWEKAPELVCNPTISIAYESKTTISTNGQRSKFNWSISGITRALISEVVIIKRYYRDTATGTSIVQGAQFSCTLPDDVNTESKYSSSLFVTYSIPSSMNYGHSFALQITYTDLIGDEKKLATNYISAVGASANASA